MNPDNHKTECLLNKIEELEAEVKRLREYIETHTPCACGKFDLADLCLKCEWKLTEALK